MDKLSEYLNMEISDEIRGVVAGMLLLIDFEGYHIGDHDLDFYRRIDEHLKKNPCSNAVEGKTFNNLKDFVTGVIEYHKYITSSNDPISDKEMQEINEDPSAYMATHFGIVY